MSALDDLRSAGFSDAEVGDYATQQRATLSSAGFSDQEINQHLGPTPDTAGANKSFARVIGDALTKSATALKPAGDTMADVGQVYPAVEAALNAGTGLLFGFPAQVVTGLGGLVAKHALGMDVDPAELAENMRKVLTYAPQTARGQRLTGNINDFLGMYGAPTAGGHGVTDLATKAGASTNTAAALGAVTEQTLGMLPFILTGELSRKMGGQTVTADDMHNSAKVIAGKDATPEAVQATQDSLHAVYDKTGIGPFTILKEAEANPDLRAEMADPNVGVPKAFEQYLEKPAEPAAPAPGDGAPLLDLNGPTEHEVANGAVDTRDANFKNWFGESKVVDEQGNPLVVYHGTPTPNFDAFNLENAGKNTGNKPEDVALHFTEKPETANYYADVGGPNGAVMPVHLALKNPLMISEKVINAEDIARAKEGGHDGIISTTDKGREYVAFKPSQVKSAIGNSGKFDPNSASLTDHDTGSGIATEPTSAKDIQQAKQAAKRTVRAMLKEGDITSEHAFRGTSLDELQEIARTGELVIGRNAEGEPATSAATVGKGDFAAYGNGSGYIAAPEMVSKSGLAGEVHVDPMSDAKQLTYLVNGKAMDFAAMKEAVLGKDGAPKSKADSELDNWLDNYMGQSSATTEAMASRKDVAGEPSDRPAGDSKPGTLAEVRSNWDAAGIKHSLSEKDGTIELGRIEVPKADRNSGIGTEAMRQLTEYADATGQRITLSPSTDFGGSSKSRLTKFYKRFGFVENKGRSRDFTTRDTMIRESRRDETTGLPLNADGTVTVYHHTSAAAAKDIRATGTLKSEAEPDVYVTTRKETDTGYGDTAVPIRVQPKDLTLDDEFPDGRKDFRLNVGRPRGSIKVNVENETTAPNRDGALNTEQGESGSSIVEMNAGLNPAASLRAIRDSYTPFVGVESPHAPVKPVADAIERGAHPVLDSLQKIFAPASRGDVAATQAGIMRANFGEMARERELALTKMKTFAAQFDKLPVEENIKFIDAYEHGVKLADPQLNAAAEALHALNKEKREEVQALGKGQLENFDENYLGRIWKDPQAESDMISRRPLTGSGAFLKARSIPFYKDGLRFRAYDAEGDFIKSFDTEAQAKAAAGADGRVGQPLTPVTTNPVEMALLKAREMDKYIYGQKIFQEMKASNLAKFVGFGEHAPAGWTKINDKIARVLQPNEGEGGGMILRGEYYAPDEAATLINNHLSSGFQGNGFYDAWRGIGNAINGLQLGLSAFHVGFTSMDAMISKASLGVKQISRGDVLEGAGNVAQGLNPAQPFVNIYKGDKLLRAYLGELNNPDLMPIVDAIQQAGGRVKMDDFYRNATVNAFKQALRRASLARAADDFGAFTTASREAASALLPTVLDRISAPIFEYLVPRQKLGVFFDMAKDWIKQNPEATVAEKRAGMGKLWDSVDNRMGQLVYDNVFWDRALKDGLMATVRSVGWNLGTFRELGGGVLDIKDIGKNKGFSDRTAYVVALPLIASIYGSILNYAYTGEAPQSLKDAFYPKTGRLRPDGSEDRVSLPTYMKDVFAYGEDLKNFVAYGGDPTQTIKNKLHPLIATVTEMLNNKDFFGGAIRNPADKAVEQLADEAAFIIQQFSPFSYRNYLQQAKAKGEEPSVMGYLTSPSMIGITPAPGYIAKSPEELESGHVSQMHDSLVTKFKEEIKGGKDVEKLIPQMIKSGMTKRDIKYIISSSGDVPKPHKLKSFGKDDE